jgi:hypothetical protein
MYKLIDDFSNSGLGLFHNNHTPHYVEPTNLEPMIPILSKLFEGIAVI